MEIGERGELLVTRNRLTGNKKVVLKVITSCSLRPTARLFWLFPAGVEQSLKHRTSAASLVTIT